MVRTVQEKKTLLKTWYQNIIKHKTIPLRKLFLGESPAGDTSEMSDSKIKMEMPSVHANQKEYDSQGIIWLCVYVHWGFINTHCTVFDIFI